MEPDVCVLASFANRLRHSSRRSDKDKDKVLISYPTIMLKMFGCVLCIMYARVELKHALGVRAIAARFVQHLCLFLS